MGIMRSSSSGMEQLYLGNIRNVPEVSGHPAFAVIMRGMLRSNARSLYIRTPFISDSSPWGATTWNHNNDAHHHHHKHHCLHQAKTLHISCLQRLQPAHQIQCYQFLGPHIDQKTPMFCFAASFFFHSSHRFLS